MSARKRQELLDRAREGDNEAQGQLLDGFRNYLRVISRAFCFRWNHSLVDDSDLIQDTLLEASRGFKGFDGKSPYDLRAWLRRIALRTMKRSLDGLSHEARTRLADAEKLLENNPATPADER